MRWAGMPNKNERAALREALDALAAAGYLETSPGGNVESPARRRLSGTLVATALARSRQASRPRGRPSVGTFALLGGAPKIVSQVLGRHMAPEHVVTLKIRQFQLDGTTPILKYDVDMQKLMHLIVVRDDFATFAHLHPSFDPKTGAFSQTFTTEPNHRYYVYADTTPHGIGQQVFRFTLESDGPFSRFALSRPALRQRASPRAHTPSRSLGRRFRRTSAQVWTSRSSRTGRPAPDLGPYLGAAAHAVFINASTLEYVHVHPTATRRRDGDGHERSHGHDRSSRPPHANARPRPSGRGRTGSGFSFAAQVASVYRAVYDTRAVARRMYFDPIDAKKSSVASKTIVAPLEART